MKTEPLVRCGILGCGATAPKSEMRAYHLIPGRKVPCCSECWEMMGIPPDYTDSEQYKADYDAACQPQTETSHEP